MTALLLIFYESIEAFQLINGYNERLILLQMFDGSLFGLIQLANELKFFIILVTNNNGTQLKKN